MKIHHPGGLYATYINTPEDNVEWKILESWVENSENYEWLAGEARFEEHFNKYNIYGLKNTDLEYWFFSAHKRDRKMHGRTNRKISYGGKMFLSKQIDGNRLNNDGKTR